VTARPALAHWAADNSEGVRRPRVGAFGVLLPGSWWTVDLRDEAARRRSVASLVERQVGRDDSRASLRADLRSTMSRTAEDAARAGGRLLAVSLMEVDGIPIPATLTMYRVAGAALNDAGAEELARVLRQSQQPNDQIDTAEGPLGPVLRRVSRRQGDGQVGGADVTLLVADYWLDPDDGHGLMSLNFTSPLTIMHDALVDLFDAIVASVGPAEDAV
jgi:hypothetical protein